MRNANELSAQIASLTAVEISTLARIFFDGHTQIEVAKQDGVSQAAISRRLLAGLSKLSSAGLKPRRITPHARSMTQTNVVHVLPCYGEPSDRCDTCGMSWDYCWCFRRPRPQDCDDWDRFSLPRRIRPRKQKPIRALRLSKADRFLLQTLLATHALRITE